MVIQRLALASAVLLLGHRSGDESSFFASAQSLASVGDEVCVEGYIMDTYCIGLGTLRDNPDVPTLEGPDVHSIHCLVDLQECIDGGYEVLIDPLEGDTTHCRSYKFDSNGNSLLLDAARSRGKLGFCTTCTNTRDAAPERGYRAAVVGTVESLGTMTTPATLAVTEVRQSSVGCPEGSVTLLPPAAEGCRVLADGETRMPTSAPVVAAPTEAVTAQELTFQLSESLTDDLTMEYGVNLLAASADGTPIAEDAITVRLTYQGEAWIGWAASENTAMGGSDSIVGVPGVGVSKYFLNGYAPEPDEDESTLIDASVVQEGGTTVLTFTKLLREAGEIEIKADGSSEMIFLWAMGTENKFGYHGGANKGHVRLTLSGASPPAKVLGVAVGDEICVEGYVMDLFCINRGTLFDNKDVVTLEGPDVHSLHCLVDVPFCVATPYEILLDPLQGDTTHCRAFQLGMAGSEQVRELAQRTGSTAGPPACTTCLGGEDEDPDLIRGFRATVRGRVTSPGDFENPPTIDLISVEESSVGCKGSDRMYGLSSRDCVEGFEVPNVAPQPLLGVSVGDEVCAEGYVMDFFCIGRGTLFDNPGVVTLEEPERHSFHCLLDVEQCVATHYEILLDPLEGDTTHCRGFQLTMDGSAEVAAKARRLGATNGSPRCTTCTGEEDQQNRGFRATVRGRVTAPGDFDTPPTIELISVEDGSVGCKGSDRMYGLSAANCVTGFEIPDDVDAPTAAPPDGAEGVECATDYQFAVELSESPRVFAEFTVHRPDAEEGSDADLDGDTSVLRARVTYAGTGWVGFGVSSDNKMPNSNVVIAMPDNDAQEVGKYFIGSYESTSIGLLAENQQTLRDVTVEQADGETVLTFTKRLREAGEIDINPDGPNTFLWAVGSSNTFGYHGSTRGLSQLTLQTCVDGGSAMGIMEGTIALPDEREWRSHGIMAFTGWGVLTPIAIASSWCRDIIGAPTWFKIHMLFNTLTFILSIALFALAVHTYSRNGQQHFQGGLPSSSHQRMGLAMFILVCLQVLGGFARPHLPPVPKAPDGADAAENGTANEEEAEKPQKSKVRIAWEFLHKLSGEALLGCSMFQIYKGLQLYEARGYPVFISTTAYWAWVGSFLGVAFLVAIGHKFLAKKKDGEK